MELQSCSEGINVANGTEWESKLVLCLLDWMEVTHWCVNCSESWPAFWKNAVYNSVAVCSLRCVYFVLQDLWQNVSCISVG